MEDAKTEKISSLIAEHFNTADTQLTASTDFESLEFDSLVLVELAVILTREYGVEVTDEELAESRTIGATASLVSRKEKTVAA